MHTELHDECSIRWTVERGHAPAATLVPELQGQADPEAEVLALWLPGVSQRAQGSQLLGVRLEWSIPRAKALQSSTPRMQSQSHLWSCLRRMLSPTRKEASWQGLWRSRRDE